MTLPDASGSAILDSGPAVICTISNFTAHENKIVKITVGSQRGRNYNGGHYCCVTVTFQIVKITDPELSLSKAEKLHNFLLRYTVFTF